MKVALSEIYTQKIHSLRRAREATFDLLLVKLRARQNLSRELRLLAAQDAGLKSFMLKQAVVKATTQLSM